MFQNLNNLWPLPFTALHRTSAFVSIVHQNFEPRWYPLVPINFFGVLWFVNASVWLWDWFVCELVMDCRFWDQFWILWLISNLMVLVCEVCIALCKSMYYIKLKFGCCIIICNKFGIWLLLSILEKIVWNLEYVTVI